MLSAAGDAGESGDDGLAGLFGGNGRVTFGLAELAFEGVLAPDGTPRRKAGKHSRFTRAR